MQVSKRTHKGIGKVESISLNQQTIHLNTTEGVVRIIVYAPDIIRITANHTTPFWDFSYATIAQPQHTPFEWQELNDHLLLKTQALQIRINKENTLFQCYTLDNQLIQEDDALGISWLGEQITAYKKLMPNERFIGLGEKTGNLDRRGTGYTNYNYDYFAYHLTADPLYQSVPFYMGVHSGLSYGIFLDNSSKTHFNFGASNDRFSSFAVESGDLDYYFIFGKTVARNIELYTHLTGRMELPPLWSLGYQQCRYSYYPDIEVLNIAQTFRDKKIPADVIYLDIHYMQDYKLFTWSKTEFPEPEKLIQALRNLGFRVVVIIDPGIKIEEGYHAYEQGKKADVFLKYPDGVYYTGQVWPGWCHFPDFTKAEARAWWATYFEELVKLGISGFWNDMNEIATWGNCLPEVIDFNMEGQQASTRQARNVYGMQMARATLEGAKKYMPNERTFNLTRAGFSGIQRYACVWTGDNVASEAHLLLSVRLVNSMGLTGQSFAGYDMGGFVGETSTQLFARWLSVAAFSPFFRGHKEVNTDSAEPWTKGRQTEEIARNYINWRYRLMPYIYAAFYESTQSGMPVQRSLAIDYTHDATIYETAFQNQYLFGQSILVCPAESHQAYTQVYLPQASAWYYAYNDTIFESEQKVVVESPVYQLPIFIKAGSIIPMQSLTQNMQEKPAKILDLHIYFGQEATQFLYYEDDGISYNYTQNYYYKRVIQFQPQQRALVIEAAEGNYVSHFEHIKVIFHQFNQISQDLNVNNKLINIAYEDFICVQPISKFDPQGTINPTIKAEVKTILMPNLSSKIEIKW